MKWARQRQRPGETPEQPESMATLNPGLLPTISLHPCHNTHDVLAVVDAGVMTTLGWKLEFTKHASHTFRLIFLVVSHE